MTVDDLLLRANVEAFLFQEARLLSSRRYEEWFGLFADPSRYRLPIASSSDAAETLEPSLVDDDLQRLRERIYRLTDTPAHAQMPPSRTVHSYTNIEVARSSPERLTAAAVFSVHELRVGGPSQVGLGEPRLLAGTVEFTILDEPELRIEEKTVWLIDRDLPLGNLAFLL